MTRSGSRTALAHPRRERFVTAAVERALSAKYQTGSVSRALAGFTPAQKCTRSIVSAATSLPFVAAGLLPMLGSGVGLYWAAAG